MKTAISIRILEHTITIFIVHATVLLIIYRGLLKIVSIDKIVASIVRWIDIDHFHFTKIAFL